MNFALLAAIAGCGGAGSSGALSVALGSERSAAVATLERNDYCRKPGPRREVENYARCDSPGLQIGESWVVARYSDDGRLDRVTRYERQPDEQKATERWESLVKSARQRFGAESKEARARLAELTEPPDGTVAWVAWFSKDASAITAMYLVRPATTKDPNVVEEIRWAVTTE